MNRLVLLTILICTYSFNSNAQSTGSFEETINFNSTNHTLAYYVPINYNSNVSYPLVVALHGCGGNAISFRNGLLAISDSLNAIILCPDFMGNQISGTNGQIIPDAINTTITNLGYNIDTTKVYLVGFSCNGQETYKHGWNEVYPFTGIIPFNAWIPSINTSYNFDSDIPTCICTGDQDGSYPNNLILYDSLTTHGGISKLNSMPGIPHTWNFSTRDSELMECFNWMDSLKQVTASTNDDHTNNSFDIFPNPVENNLSIRNLEKEEVTIIITNIQGKIILEKITNDYNISVNTSAYTNGTYFIQLRTKQGIIKSKKIIVRK